MTILKYMDPSAPAFTTHLASAEEEVKSYTNSIMKAGWRKWLIIAGVVVLFVIFWTWVTNPMVVTVSGSGQVSVPATNATISFTLSSTNNDPSSAIKDVDAKADQMEAYLQSKGFAQGNVARSQVTVVPANLISSGAQGFQATISMAAKTIDVQSIPVLIPSLYGNGAVVVAQPILSVENQNDLDQQAFNSALNDANNQANNIGNSKWKFIRKIISISQVSSPTTSTSTTKADVSNTNPSALANGVFKIVKAVSVTYKMW